MFTADFFANNRKKLSNKIGDSSIAILCSGREVRKSADVMYPFFANRNYYYLTGLEEPNAFLVLYNKEGVLEEYLFVEKVSPVRERWYGKRLSDEEITCRSSIQNIYDSSVFAEWLLKFLYSTKCSSIYFDIWRYDEADPVSIAEKWAEFVRERFQDIDILNLHEIMTRLRTIKENEEILHMRKAVEITRYAFLQMMKKAKVGMKEYQLKAEFDYAIAYKGIKDAAFQPIITTGKNNFCIHYSAYTREICPGDLLLCDSGVNYQGICCDVSRVWPVDEWFTEIQEKYYRCALAASNEMFSRVKPGITMRDVYKMQHRILRAKIVEFGIAKDEEEAKMLIWHGGSHHIGIDNHDEVYIEKYPENILEKNMVFAVDMGIYNPIENVGLRVEDDCLVTATGCGNLTKTIPRELDELREVLKIRN